MATIHEGVHRNTVASDPKLNLIPGSHESRLRTGRDIRTEWVPILTCKRQNYPHLPSAFPVVLVLGKGGRGWRWGWGWWGCKAILNS